MAGKPFLVKMHLESDKEKKQVELRDEAFQGLVDKETYVLEVVPEGPVNGEVRVKYNHYNKAFPIVNGALSWETIDDQYSFSFVF